MRECKAALIATGLISIMSLSNSFANSSSQILIFGKNGQLGRAFQNALRNHAPQHIQFIGRGVGSHEEPNTCDLENPLALEQLLKKQQPNLIINAAAYTAVDQAEADKERAFAINATAVQIMAEYAAKTKATLLHYSTDYVFDGKKEVAYLETDLPEPLGMYGASKAAGEAAIIALAPHYAIFRTSWVYGDGANFIRTILRLAKEREELAIVSDQFGAPTSAAWLAQISLDFIAQPFKSGIYHAVPDGDTTWYELACLVVQTALDAGASLKLQVANIRPIPSKDYPTPAPRPNNSKMANMKLKRVFADRLAASAKDSVPDFPHWQLAVIDYVQQLVKQVK